jgi:hypothetical protein
MKKYVITEEQRNLLLNAFGRVVGEISFQPLLVLNQLKEVEEVKQEKQGEE